MNNQQQQQPPQPQQPPPPQLRVTDYLPKRFSGEGTQSPLAHWLQFADYLQIHAVPAPQQVNRFKLTLSGDARLWFEGKAFNDLNALKNSFIEHFSGYHSREGSLAAFRSIKWKHGEAMETYLGRLRPLAERLGYDNDQIRDQFIEGLPHDVKVSVVMARCGDLNTLVETAQKYIDLIKSHPKEVSFSHTEEISYKDELEELINEFRAFRGANNNRRSRERAPVDRQRARSRSNSRSKERGTKGAQCNYCGSTEHFWRECKPLMNDLPQLAKTRGNTRRERSQSDERRSRRSQTPNNNRQDFQ